MEVSHRNPGRQSQDSRRHRECHSVRELGHAHRRRGRSQLLLNPQFLLDTHVVVLSDSRRLSREQMRVLEAAVRNEAPLGVSAMSLVEIAFAREGRGRLMKGVSELLYQLGQESILLRPSDHDRGSAGGCCACRRLTRSRRLRDCRNGTLPRPQTLDIRPAHHRLRPGTRDRIVVLTIP